MTSYLSHTPLLLPDCLLWDFFHNQSLAHGYSSWGLILGEPAQDTWVLRHPQGPKSSLDNLSMWPWAHCSPVPEFGFLTRARVSVSSNFIDFIAKIDKRMRISRGIPKSCVWGRSLGQNAALPLINTVCECVCRCVCTCVCQRESLTLGELFNLSRPRV